MIVRGEIDGDKLEIIYDTCNRLFKGQNKCFYTSEELERKKQENKSQILRKEIKNGKLRDL